MLSTRDVTQQSSGQRKTLSPGNYTVRIYDMELVPGPTYLQDSYHIILHVEGPALGPEFDGFLKDPNNPGGPKFAGQVGKVKMGHYAFADTTTKNGNKISRDQTMLRAIDMLSVACDVQEQVKSIDASDWDDMIRQVKRVVIGRSVSICLGSRLYTNKSGYKDHQLFLPRPDGGKLPLTKVGDPNILVYDANNPDHAKFESAPKVVESFGETKADDDFNLF